MSHVSSLVPAPMAPVLVALTGAFDLAGVDGQRSGISMSAVVRSKINNLRALVGKFRKAWRSTRRSCNPANIRSQSPEKRNETPDGAPGQPKERSTG